MKRIEIIRGPLSSAYGSAALSGVINIITKEADAKAQATVNVIKGDSGLNSISSTFSQDSDHYKYSMTGSYNNSGEQVSGTELESRSGDITGAWFFNDATQLKFHTRYYESDGSSFPDDSGGSDFAVNRNVEKRDVFESVSNLELIHSVNRLFELSLKGSLFHHEEDTTSTWCCTGCARSVRNSCK